MRPHKLTIENFGPFAKKTVIDFDAMGSGLYLIAGDTGAGKTTIFDALMYALYGEASGSARKGLATTSYHSDFAKHIVSTGERQRIKNDPMTVELDFSESNKRYRVVREMNWGKSGTSQTACKTAVLYDEEGNTLEMSDKADNDRNSVTKEIINRIGLTSEQFRQIIMLSQGEFKKFLDAGSKDREEILGKIYDNSMYKDLQARIKATTKRLEEKRKDFSDVLNAKQYVIVQNLPDDFSPEDRVIYENENAYENPDYIYALDSLQDKYDELLQVINNSISEYEEKNEELISQIAKAEEINNLYANLEKATGDREQLEAKKDVMDKLEKKLSDAETANEINKLYEKVVEDINNEILKAKATLSDICNNLDKKNNEMSDISEKKERCEKEEKTKLQEITIKITNYESILGKYDFIESKRSEKQKAEEEKEKSGKELEDLQNKEKSILEQKNSYTEILKELVDVNDDTVRRTEAECESEISKKTAICEVKDKIGQINSQILEEKELQEKYLKQLETAKKAVDNYCMLYRQFFDGQAGLLAKKLKEELATKGEADCPVCGHHYCSGDEINCIAHKEKIPERSEVEEAKEIMDSAGDLEKSLNEKRKIKASDIEKDKEYLKKEVEKLFGIELELNDLSDFSFVDGEYDKTQKRIKELESALKKENGRNNNKKELTNKLDETEKELPGIREKIDIAFSKSKECNEAYTRADTEYKSALESIKEYPQTKDLAEDELNNFTQEKKRIEEYIRDTDDNFKSCSEAISELTGNKKQLEELLNATLIKLEKKTEELNAQIKKSDFENYESYRLALCSDEWIKEKKGQIDSYKKACSDVCVMINQYTKSIANRKKEDLDKKHSEQDEIVKKIKAARNSYTLINEKYAKIKEAVEDIKKNINQMRKYDVAINKVKPLDETANSSYKFSTYVLEHFFNSILENANNHLDVISDGQYQLLAKKDGDLRGTVGLDIEVYDEFTNKTRATASLSGGESFGVSLALALGLSDMAQQENAGKINVECMFIDEGFGSLDAGALNKALDVLNKLASGNRQIGIISHVDALEEIFCTKKLWVKGGKDGSTVEMINSI